MEYSEIKNPIILEQLVLGSVLGDGHLTSLTGGSVNSRLSYGHSEKQLEYLKWKLKFLEDQSLVTPNGISKQIRTSGRYKDGESISYHARSYTHPFITKYRNAFYIEGKKVLNFDFLQNMDTLALAIWYMDDGFVCTNSVSFATDSFSIKELLQLQVLLWDKFELLTTFGDSRQLHIRHQYFTHFKELISPYVIESLKYKLIPYKFRVLNKSGELRGQPEAVNPEPSISLKD